VAQSALADLARVHMMLGVMHDAVEERTPLAMDKLGPIDVRELGLGILRDFRARHPGVTRVELERDFLRPLFAHALRESGVQPVPDACTALARDCLERAALQPVLEFIWWLVRAGYAVPLLGSKALPEALEITAAGATFLSAPAGDHPLLPGFIDRLRQRCAGLPEETLLHLRDAKACLEHGLHRPAIVLIAAAYEVALERLGDQLMQAGKLKRSFESAKPWERINLLKNALPNLGLPVDDRAQVARALDYAHKLRERRGDAATSAPIYPFDQTAELEEFLISACRHLPSLWLVRGLVA
jgi:hypothetical protein